MTHLTPAQPTPDWLQALHSSDSAWIITDDDLNVIHINEGLTRLLGYRLEDLQGKRPLETLVQAWPDLAAHIREQLMLSGAYHGELQVQRFDGSQVWMAATVNTLLTEIKAGNFANYGGKVETLGLVSGTDLDANYVGIPASTQYAEGFTAEDYAALVAKMFAGEVTVSNDTETQPEVALTVTYYGNIK